MVKCFYTSFLNHDLSQKWIDQHPQSNVGELPSVTQPNCLTDWKHRKWQLPLRLSFGQAQHPQQDPKYYRKYHQEYPLYSKGHTLPTPLLYNRHLVVKR